MFVAYKRKTTLPILTKVPIRDCSKRYQENLDSRLNHVQKYISDANIQSTTGGLTISIESVHKAR